MVTLSAADRKEIASAIRRAESGTHGEIRVHLKRGATKDALAEARTVFSRLGMHRTREHSGVLIFVSDKSRSFAIVGDEGIHRKAGDAFWNETRDRMQALFSEQRLKEGILAGVTSAGEKLAAYFPVRTDDPNELPDHVSEG